jgi:hypothetical protein
VIGVSAKKPSGGGSRDGPRHRIARLACLGLVTLAISANAPHALSRTAATLTIRSVALEMSLDPEFPRVFAYRTRAGDEIQGAQPDSRPAIVLNGRTYTAGDFDVGLVSTSSAVVYSMHFRALGLLLKWRLEASEQGLDLALIEVHEEGGFQLATLDFPDHYLIRVPSMAGKGEAYRGEYKPVPWKGPFGGLLPPSTAHFMKIGDEDAEATPSRANWASANVPGISATIWDNIPYWKLETQLLGREGTATDFAIWLGRYYYRIGGEVQPLLHARVAVLTEDRNADGAINWMEAALWLHDQLRTPTSIHDPRSFNYSVILDWVKPEKRPVGGYDPPIMSFADTLEIVRAVAHSTGGAPQHVVLVGWQFTGHDTGYPALNQVNDRVGGIGGLRILIKEAARYNASIHFHINLNDAKRDNPQFDPTVLQFDRTGAPFVWARYFDGAPDDYRISATKQYRSGYFQRRMQEMLDLVPVSGLLELDTFRATDISTGPGEDIGIVSEALYGRKILEWLVERGVQPSIEGPDDAWFGTVERSLHLAAITDPFHLLMMHGKLFGGGKYREGCGQVLGWSMDGVYSTRDFISRVDGFSVERYDEDQISDMYFLGNLTQSYLAGKNLVWLGAEGAGAEEAALGRCGKFAGMVDYVGRFSDGTVSKVTHDGYWTVIDHGVRSVDGARRELPLDENRVLLYSTEGGTFTWDVPSSWGGARISVREVGRGAGKGARYVASSRGTLLLAVTGHRAYIAGPRK